MTENMTKQELKMLEKGYVVQSKLAYIIIHSLVPIIVGSVALVYFFYIKDWVEKHKNQRKTYG